MKYLLVQNVKTKRPVVFIAAKDNEQADVELGMLTVKLKELRSQIGESEVKSFDNLYDLNHYLLQVTSTEKPTVEQANTYADLENELNTKLTHGIFKFRTLREAVNENPSWVLWSADTVPFFNPSADVTYMAWAKCSEKDQERYMHYSGTVTTKTATIQTPTVAPEKATMHKEVQQQVVNTDKIDKFTDDLPF